jgi:hypothetical protein
MTRHSPSVYSFVALRLQVFRTRSHAKNNPSAATLAGTTSVRLNNGVAVFPNLHLNKAGSGFMLAAGDQLFGGAGKDWFLAALASIAGAKGLSGEDVFTGL